MRHRWSWLEIIPQIASNENCDKTVQQDVDTPVDAWWTWGISFAGFLGEAEQRTE
jgi:hypothetical protein